jgi:hypothetical protein
MVPRLGLGTLRLYRPSIRKKMSVPVLLENYALIKV